VRLARWVSARQKTSRGTITSTAGGTGRPRAVEGRSPGHSRSSTSSKKMAASGERMSKDGSGQRTSFPARRFQKPVDARAIVSPFDPLMWERSWARAVFGFEYQIEIYVPAPKRVHGYYVLPFLLGDRFAARVDLKADRKASTLVVHSAHLESSRDEAETADALANELRSIAAWLSLESITVARKGRLAKSLKRAVRNENPARAMDRARTVGTTFD